MDVALFVRDIEDRTVIGQAIGMVMEEWRVGQVQASDAFMDSSVRNRIDLAEVARILIRFR